MEGHNPIEVVQPLIQGRPRISGIALPGMASGLPGMPGDREAPLTIYSVRDEGFEMDSVPVAQAPGRSTLTTVLALAGT